MKFARGTLLLVSSFFSLATALAPLASQRKSSIANSFNENWEFKANDDEKVPRAGSEKPLAWESFIQKCQTGISCGVASALFLLSPLPSHAASITHAEFGDQANIIFEPREKKTFTTNADALQQQSSLAKHSMLLRSSSQLIAESTQEQGAVVEEVWKLVDKYYIDRTFNGQDWNKIEEVYQARLKSNGDETKVVKEMVQTLGDKYSRMLDVQQYTAIQKYDLIGVGVTLMPNQDKQVIVGAPPIAGSAAEKAGLRVGDKVVAVNGMQTKGLTAFDIIDQISENPNAQTITMTIQSVDNENDERDVNMNRKLQEIKNPIRYKISETRSDGTKVGYVRISEFNALVKANLEDALANLKKEGANTYVIDLRMNGGGSFQSAVEISSLFFENRVATYVVDGSTAILPFKAAKGQQIVPTDAPVVLWVDGGSASASEVLAGSLHDNCRAVIMGDKSFGKGLIQAVYGLKNGSGLVLTVAKYVTPNQNEIQGIGITPDIPGKNILPPLLPGIGSDTSKIDFADIKNRLSSNLCAIPEQK